MRIVRSERLGSSELYLRHDAATVVGADVLEDDAAGIYPCYYLREGGRLLAAGSVAPLVAVTGRLVPNAAFAPPDYLGQHRRRRGPWVRAAAWLRRWRGRAPVGPRPWYETWESVDARICKLRAFERVTAWSVDPGFRAEPTITDPTTLVEATVAELRAYVDGIEAAFPAHDHVVMLGGKDSQVVWLVPKRRPERWHVFSAHPNAAVNVEWIRRNGLAVGRTIVHDNRNDESPEDFRRKVVVGDLYSDPSHIRWLPAAARLARTLGGRCIFWGGTMSGPAHFYLGHPGHVARRDPAAFFPTHFGRTATWQGNYHQVFKCFVGVPYLSPYHSAAIWERLYRRVDPAAIVRDVDLRPEIGERLHGRAVWWPEVNPAPAPWESPWRLDLRRSYLEHLRGLAAPRTGHDRYSGGVRDGGVGA